MSALPPQSVSTDALFAEIVARQSKELSLLRGAIQQAQANEAALMAEIKQLRERPAAPDERVD